MQRRVDWELLSRFAGIGALALAWELSSRLNLLPREFFPPLSEVFGALAAALLHGGLIQDEGLTLARTLVGTLAAGLLGVALAVLTSTFRTMDGLMAPIIEFLRPLPPAAMIPIATFFVGVGNALFLLTVVFAAVWPIYVSTANALRSTDGVVIDTARTYGCGRWALLFQIRLPSAGPEILTGLRVGTGMALLATLLAEMLAGQRGLGYRLFDSAFSLHTAEMFGVMIVAGLTGILVNTLVIRIGAFFLGWRILMNQHNSESSQAA